ncbi:allatostatin-A receptor-like isoform X4 [Dermatophagoides pteronyssinus]|uniref:allatostatin-A receptor-like isoform X4 n=1 Tax=Dermatophagoides pteronyssinus TaxID=6956 RepID=UPI003F6660FE
MADLINFTSSSTAAATFYISNNFIRHQHRQLQHQQHNNLSRNFALANYIASAISTNVQSLSSSSSMSIPLPSSYMAINDIGQSSASSSFDNIMLQTNNNNQMDNNNSSTTTTSFETLQKILVLMSLDRYLAVAHPIRSISLRTVKNANRALLILWIFILLFCIPTFFTHDVSYDQPDGAYSVCNFLTDKYNHALYQVIFCLFSYIIPIILILILYVLMLKRLWFSGIPGRNMSTESVRSKKKVTRMVVIVFIIFACCWCPIQIILVLRSFNIYELSTTKVIIQITGHILAYMNSCMNPILYAFLSENFRKAFRRVIACNRQPKNRSEQTELTIGMCQNNNTNNTTTTNINSNKQPNTKILNLDNNNNNNNINNNNQNDV